MSVIESMRIQIDEKKALISLDAIPDDLEIFGDKLHLANVFTNLIDNSLKYNRDQPEITFAARHEGDGILISIQDNGIGIPASKCKMIFEKFERLEDQSSRDQKGFGLGLAYVKRIIELHKGTIQLDGHVHQGSRFNLFLPKLT
jgi:two-component system phosphate regulon sensor histidine kinase PhoR